MSLKYGTPNLCAKSYTTSFPKGSIGRQTRTPFTTFSGSMPVTERGGLWWRGRGEGGHVEGAGKESVVHTVRA